MLQVHGHRGARAVLAENTLAGFAYAFTAGADFVEMDVHVTRDDVPVIAHDPVLASGEAIRELTFSELRRVDPWMPTLDEVLELGGAGFNIEMKSLGDPPPDRCAELLLQAIAKHAVESRVIVQSFDFRVLHAMKLRAPLIRLAALVETGRPDFAGTAQEAGAGIIAPEHHLVTPQQVAAAHAAAIQVVPWTVNAPADWQRLVAAGVDGIITDDPAALIAWLRQRGLR